MKLTDFHYHLPPALIAQQPTARRTASRLLHVEAASGSCHDRHFTDFIDLLRPDDLLVFNNTRVIPARLWGRKATGGKVEVLVERVINQHEVLAHIRASKSPKAGSRLLLDGGLDIEMMGREGALFQLKFLDPTPVTSLLEQHGHMPLPPYITRDDGELDRERYQTVYASKPGAVAAPTAGLHFDTEVMATLKARGIQTCEVTLHVGAGTFQPVKVDKIEDHHMHSEYLEVDSDTVAAVQAAKQRGGRVVAIGTTSVRALESAASSGQLQTFTGETSIFIYPGYQFRVVDALLTNFHLPESTLLMLVSAFAGYDLMMQAYMHAVSEKYRFFSYGDAMFIEPPGTKNEV